MRDYRQIRTISGRGPGREHFSDALRGICTDGGGHLLAAGDDRVKIFDSDGALLRGWNLGKPGHCVLADAQGVIRVGESGQVESFSEEGALLGTLRDPERLGLVSCIGRSGDDLLLGDATHRCIRRYDRRGKWLNDLGAQNNTRGFLIPNGHLDFAVDAAGIVHACNPGKYRIERYTSGGELLGFFGRFGTRNVEDFPGCCNPTNVALLEGGEVVVTEKAPARAKVYDAAGGIVAVIGAEAFDQNSKNMDVAVDSRGSIYIVETTSLVVRVFARFDGVQSPATKGGA